MDIDIVSPAGALPVKRAWTVSMVIKTFKGRKDVVVRLFRPSWLEREERAYDWPALLVPESPETAFPEYRRRVLLEAFTAAERDALVAALQCRYADKVSSIRARTLEFPISREARPLFELDEGKDAGCIHFERLPDWHLPFPVRGAFDLSQHLPIIEGPDQT